MSNAAVRAPGKVKKTLAGVLGSVAAAVSLFTMTPDFESGRKVEAKPQADGSIAVRHIAGKQYLKAYLDIVGVATACDGITKGVRLGQRYTEAQCTAMLEEQLIAHAEEVMACVPQLYGRANEAAAAVSLAYNIGGPRFCTSTAARMFRARRWGEGCDAIPMWNKAGGRVVRGLVNRRRAERALCRKVLP